MEYSSTFIIICRIYLFSSTYITSFVSKTLFAFEDLPSNASRNPKVANYKRHSNTGQIKRIIKIRGIIATFKFHSPKILLINCERQVWFVKSEWK